MGRAGLLSTALVILGVMTAPAEAQNLRNPSPPSETPPDSFSGTQFVDSRGCVYVRAGIGGATNWVPRVNRQRKQLCGFEPTLAAMAAPPPAPVPAPQAAPEPVAPRVASAAPNAPRPAAAPEAAPAAPTPRVVRQPSPTPSVAPAPERRRITRAEACAGRTGIQPNMVSARTGEPIDCGPGRAALAAADPAAPLATPTEAGPRRLTMAELCAEQASTDRKFVDARTGQPITCTLPAAPVVTNGSRPVQQPLGLQVALSLPQAPYSNPLDWAPGSARLRDGAQAPSVQAAPQPTGNVIVDGLNAPVVRSLNPLDHAPGTASLANISQGQVQTTRARNSWTFGRPAPYSNPANAPQRITPTPPEGFESAWDDGRLNPSRGLPNRGRYATQPSAVPQQQVSSRNAPQASRQPASEPSRTEAISGQLYVQVGTFASRDAAQSAAQGLRARGLPMRIGVYDRSGTQYRIVLAGPFTSNVQVQNALNKARGAGLADAFARR
jgi:cell division protein FtsN